MLEKQVVKEFVQLFKMKYQKHWYANRLIKTVSEGARLNGAYRCGLIKGVSDFLFDYPGTTRIYKDKRDKGKDIIIYNIEDGMPFVEMTYRNLWIEFKAGKNKQTAEQIQFQSSREEDGSKYIVCYSAEDAIEQIKEYLGG